MVIPENSGQIVAIIASLGMLTPLIKALHKWHIDVRKTAKPSQGNPTAPAQTVQTGSRWSRMSRFDRLTFIYGASGHLTCLILLVILTLLPAHAATSRDVGVAGILVLSALSVGRFMED